MSHTLVKFENWVDFFLSASQNGVGFPAMTNNKVSREHRLMHF